MNTPGEIGEVERLKALYDKDRISWHNSYDTVIFSIGTRYNCTGDTTGSSFPNFVRILPGQLIGKVTSCRIVSLRSQPLVLPDWWAQGMEIPGFRVPAQYAPTTAEYISYDMHTRRLIEEGINLLSGETGDAEYLRETLPFLVSIFPRGNPNKKSLTDLLDELVIDLEKKKGTS